ncbi:MAG: hypothetical protein WCK77_12240 [Verrucomicrobiota bacterium]
MGKLIHILRSLTLGAAVLPLLAGQPALAANPKAAVPAAAASAASAAPQAKATDSTPSRYAGNDIKAYVTALANQLAIRDRASDPFGQLQDPNAKPVVKPTLARPIRRATTAEPPASLSDIVGRIEITTIMPRDKRFLVGSRSIGQGDKLPLSFHNKQIHIEVIEVSSQRIVFRNVETGELGVRQLNLLPKGMTPGTHGLSAPGMVPATPNNTLEIDSLPPSTAPATNP